MTGVGRELRRSLVPGVIWLRGDENEKRSCPLERREGISYFIRYRREKKKKKKNEN